MQVGIFFMKNSISKQVFKIVIVHLCTMYALNVYGENNTFQNNPMGSLPEQLVGAEISNMIGNVVPLNTRFIDENGDTIILGDFFDGLKGKPVLLTIGYYECPMLCDLVHNAIFSSLPEVGLKIGEDFQIVSLTVNPEEKPALAKKKYENYQKELEKRLGYVPHPQSWRILTIDPKHLGDIDRIANAVGFGYKKDGVSEDFAHAAGIFFVSPDGLLSRTLWGLSYNPRDMKFSLMDASQGKLGSVIDKILITCFQLSHDGKYTATVWGIMRIGGGIMVTLMAVLLSLLWFKEKQKIWLKKPA
jgi:protein SCO1/2